MSLYLTLSLFAQSDAEATDKAALNLHRWGAVTLFHGLPSDRVNAIAEDASGALWFGTDNGLVRYDGRRTQLISDDGALPARRVRALKLDGSGRLWIGTDEGAARLAGERIEALAETRGQAVSSIAESPQGEIALVTEQGEIIRYRDAAGSGGKPAAFKLGPDSQPLLSYAPRPGEQRALELTGVAFSGADQWWIGTRRRGVLINRQGEVREAWPRPQRPYLVSALYAEADRIWFGEQASRREEGLWSYSGGALARFPLATGAVTAIHGGDGEVWVGTKAQGALLLKESRLIEHLTFENTAGGLRSNQINAVFRDREGVVWFGTDRGVCRYDRDSFRIAFVSQQPQSNFVRALLETTDGEAWCGTNRGLFRLALGADLGQWAEASEVGARAVYALAEDSAGAVWAGTSSGLFVRAKGSSAFTRLAPESSPSDEVTGEPEASEAADAAAASPSRETQANDPQAANPNQSPRESVRAMAIFRGRVHLSVFGRGIERIEEGKRTLSLSDPAAQRALCLAADGDAALWIGTAAGEVLRFDGAQMSPLVLMSGQTSWGEERAVRAISAGSKRVWIGTAKGLFVWDGNRVHEVLPEIDVRALLVMRDGAGRDVVWCGTQNAGLIKLLAESRISIRFDTEQGLASQQVFALTAGSGERAGVVWIGSNRGIALHRPSYAEPRLEVRRLVADQVYTPEYLTAELRLPHTQKNFLLEVAALGSRTFPSLFQYEFTLADRRGQVVKSARTPDAQFAVEGLAPGPYTITVRAISRDLIYSAPLMVRLRIPGAPFPWTTLLLATLLGVAVAAAGWAFWQHIRTARANRELEQTNEELREMRIRLAKETESERSRIARDLHDQTLADLRHLLVLTDQLNLPVADGVTPAALRREIEAISSEIRQICEDLSPSVLENIGLLPALEWALTDAVAHLPAGEKFAYEFICEPELEERLALQPIEQIQLYRLVQEAINNVCRHAQAREVSLVVRTESRDLIIEVKDDGVGFDGSLRSASKTGHGMANIRSRANLISAQVAWRRAARGCHFEVRKAGCVKESPKSEVQSPKSGV